ncbi:MAG: GAF domain-containing protein [Deltaproteobacteria bacterium]|nr:GAF domain-containing protein [Deltaproteobacteria bacterium]
MAEKTLDVIWTMNLDLEFTYVNRACLSMTGYTPEEFIGSRLPKHCDEKNFAKITQLITDEMAKGTVGAGVIFETVILKKNHEPIPVEIHGTIIYDDQGQPVGLQGVARDITERKRVEYMNQVRMRLLEFAPTHSLEQLLRKTLDEVGPLVDSPIGFYHFVETDQKTLTLQTWSSATIDRFCKAEGTGLNYGIDQAGAWVDCLRQRHPVIYNNYASLPHRKGTPEGHAAVTRELVVPIFRGDRIVAILGVGNKPQDYNERDVEVVNYLADVAWEIAQHKRNEEALKESEGLLRIASKLVHLGGWSVNLSENRVIWSDEVAAIHEKPPGYLPTTDEGIDFYAPEFREKMREVFTACAQEGRPYDEEMRIITGKGRRVWVRTIAVAERDNTGLIVRIKGGFQDITERKLAEQRIKHLNRVLQAIRHVHQLIIRERDRDTLIRECCRLLVDNRGYGSALIVLTDENDRPLSWSYSGIAAASGPLNAMLERGELPLCCDRARNNGKIVPIRDRHGICGHCPIATPCSDQDSLCGRLFHGDASFGYLSVAVEHGLGVDAEELSLFDEMADDLAYALHVLKMDKDREKSERERKSLEDQLLQSQKMESVGRLAGGVAHDFNNMLTVIMGNAELSLSGLHSSDPIHRNLKEILDAGKRSADLTRQLLAFARKQTISPIVLGLNETVESMLKMLRRLMGEDIDILWKPCASQLQVKMDPAQIDQIMANLCVNARDAIAGVGKVTIETESITFNDEYCAHHIGFVPGEFVLLAVSDDGNGMDKEILDKIFEPFFTTKKEGKGTGLGLATVYGIVKQNKGFINVYSELGQGTTLKIYLPRHEGKGIDTQTTKMTAFIQGHGEVVLLVEDELTILKMGKYILEKLGYTVLAADKPGEAVHLAQKYSSDIQLLITDVVMPEMNGRELAQRLQEINPNMKCLYTSGYTANAIAHRGVLYEGVNFLQKPFSIQALATKVHEVLDSQ